MIISVHNGAPLGTYSKKAHTNLIKTHAKLEAYNEFMIANVPFWNTYTRLQYIQYTTNVYLKQNDTIFGMFIHAQRGRHRSASLKQVGEDMLIAVTDGQKISHLESYENRLRRDYLAHSPDSR